MPPAYNAILAIGRKFDTEIDALDFLISKEYVNDRNLEEIKKYGLWDYLGDIDLEGGAMNCFTGEGFWIGWNLSLTNLIESIRDKSQNWRLSFHEEPEIILEVEVF